MKQFYFGIIFFSLCIGLLVGASNTPAVGAFITAIFGVIVGVVSLFGNKDKPALTLSYNQVGSFISLFSLFLIAGTYAGSLYRTSAPKEQIFLPWTSGNEPKSTYEALDWIAVVKILKDNGLKDEDIKAIYKIKLEELKKQVPGEPAIYNESFPYAKMLSTLAKEKKEKLPSSRGPASED